MKFGENEVGVVNGGHEGMEMCPVPTLSHLLSAWVRGREITKGVLSGSVFARTYISSLIFLAVGSEHCLKRTQSHPGDHTCSQNLCRV